MKKVHLLCNAHLDPAWLWQIEEGAGEALSTFRIAADFCERYDGFVFNHNEVILYKWIEELDPALFRRIQKLVEQGKWHIMGGWYLQPDCNLPSGESFVRQILTGRRYFAEKFGAWPTTAINFDPFGHSRGLVQIMAKAGYDSYIVCRPGQEDCPLPADDFVWVGYDGSEVIGHRAYKAYLSGRGRAHTKIEGFMADHPEQEVGLVLWGIGNHGGGPSREDLENIQELRERTATHELVHSTPEAYFAELRASGQALPKHEGDLNAWAVGCYTSQIRIKQKHRQLENELFAVEKMVSSAALQGFMAYPAKELGEAQEDLLIAEFHDMLPGSSIRPVEDDTLRLMDHGLEILSRLRMRAFFALTSGEAKAAEHTVPLFLYNPHPYKVKGLFEVEYQLPQSSKGQFAYPVVMQEGRRLPGQVEKELSSLYIDWRKRVVFYAELEPYQMNRFDCGVEFMAEKPKPALQPTEGRITFETERLRVVINGATGLVDEFVVDGRAMLKEQAFRPIVMADKDDAWGHTVQRFPDRLGEFRLMPKARAMRASGLKGKPLDAVRVIEDGDARTVVEALLEYGRSSIVMRYHLPKIGTEVRLDLIVNWNEKKSLLKLAVPTAFDSPRYRGQVAYGSDDLPTGGKEVVAQKWTAAVSDEADLAFTCINDGIYGSDMTDGEIRLTLLRSPGYSALPGGKMPNTMPKDRYSDRMDQGERRYTFWFQGGSAAARLASVDREALAHNEKPYALTYFPSGEGVKAQPLAMLSDDTVLMTAFKRAEDGDGYIVRLFEPTGTARSTKVTVPTLGIEEVVELAPFEIKTCRLRPGSALLAASTLLEEADQRR